MQIINQSYKVKLLADFTQQTKLIEECGRTAYRSEDLITDESASKFVSMIRKRNHGAVLEHSMMTVKFITDRGVSHELVRHRLASFTQESTRYVSSHEKPLKVDATDENIIDLYVNQGFSMLKISKMVKPSITEDAVFYRLKKAGITRRGLNNKGPRDEMFFHVIDTPQKAYLLGLIQADGSLGNNKKYESYQISISQKNGWFIERLLADFIGVKTSGSKDGVCRNYSFAGKQWYTDLIAKGIIPNKTYDQTDTDIVLLWNSIPTEYKWDFLRGLLDGDGHLRFYCQNNSAQTKSFLAGWFGHPQLLNYIKIFLNDQDIVSSKISKDLKSKNNAHTLSVSGYSNGVAFCKQLYRNYIFPYGKPEKVSRVFSELPDLPYTIADWGSSKFKVIRPVWCTVPTQEMYIWAESMSQAEKSYKNLIELGWSSQQARSVLPNSLKTQIVVTTNLREWLHIFQLRAIEKAAHPQMRALMIPLYQECRQRAPQLFDLGDPE